MATKKKVVVKAPKKKIVSITKPAGSMKKTMKKLNKKAC